MITFENGQKAKLLLRDTVGTGGLSLEIPDLSALLLKIEEIGRHTGGVASGTVIDDIAAKLMRGDCISYNDVHLELHQLTGPRSVDPDPVSELMKRVSELSPNQLKDLARRVGALHSKGEKGPKFDVRLTAMAYVQARTDVYADDAEKAAEAALEWARAGDIEWVYDGLCEGEDQGPEVSSVEQTE